MRYEKIERPGPRLTLRVLTDISACRIRKRSDGASCAEPMHALVAVEEHGHSFPRDTRRRFEDGNFAMGFPFGFRIV